MFLLPQHTWSKWTAYHQLVKVCTSPLTTHSPESGVLKQGDIKEMQSRGPQGLNWDTPALKQQDQCWINGFIKLVINRKTCDLKQLGGCYITSVFPSVFQYFNNRRQLKARLWMILILKEGPVHRQSSTVHGQTADQGNTSIWISLLVSGLVRFASSYDNNVLQELLRAICVHNMLV